MSWTIIRFMRNCGLEEILSGSVEILADLDIYASKLVLGWLVLRRVPHVLAGEWHGLPLALLCCVVVSVERTSSLIRSVDCVMGNC
jgi:hypothetical protein